MSSLETTGSGENKPEPEQKLLEKPKLSGVRADPNLWKEALQFAEMLNYCRPNGSRVEQKFINKFIRPIGGIKYDKKGNIYKRIGDAPVLWSCHTDTVHRTGGFQKVEYWPSKKGDTFFGVAKGSHSSCLGADDTCGVWIMLEMIKKQVPGLYIFHRAEEVGGVGSRFIASNNKEALNGIRFAIAFDRRGTNSVITYQRSKRCCSDEFAKSLAEQLNMGHTCDETGSFTDTASYVDLVAECTNVSAGYYDAHMPTESTNVDYLFKLRDAFCKLDISKLVEKRKPGENTSRYPDYSSHYSGTYYQSASRGPDCYTYLELLDLLGSADDVWNLCEYRDGWWRFKQGCTPPESTLKSKKDVGVTKGWKNYKAESYHGKISYSEMIRLIKANPEIVADLLETLSYSPDELRNHIFDSGGLV